MDFIRPSFSASQSPLGKTGHINFEKDFSYLMQCFVVSCEGSREISQLPLCLAPPVSFQMSSTVSNFYCFLYPHSITVFYFTTHFACFLNKVFIDIHCFIQHNKKYGIHKEDICVSFLCLFFQKNYSVDKSFVLLKRWVKSCVVWNNITW